MSSIHTEVPVTPPIELPNNGNLQPTGDVTVLTVQIVMLLTVTVKTSPYTIDASARVIDASTRFIRESRFLYLVYQALKEKSQSSDKE